MPPTTLRTKLNLLIIEYTLPEVLDRLAEMVAEQNLKDTEDFQPLWGELAGHLDRATETSLTLLGAKQQANQQLWD